MVTTLAGISEMANSLIKAIVESNDSGALRV
jgi:hypothetical protein